MCGVVCELWPVLLWVSVGMAGVVGVASACKGLVGVLPGRGCLPGRWGCCPVAVSLIGCAWWSGRVHDGVGGGRGVRFQVRVGSAVGELDGERGCGGPGTSGGGAGATQAQAARHPVHRTVLRRTRVHCCTPCSRRRGAGGAGVSLFAKQCGLIGVVKDHQVGRAERAGPDRARTGRSRPGPAGWGPPPARGGRRAAGVVARRRPGGAVTHRRAGQLEAVYRARGPAGRPARRLPHRRRRIPPGPHRHQRRQQQRRRRHHPTPLPSSTLLVQVARSTRHACPPDTARPTSRASPRCSLHCAGGSGSATSSSPRRAG